MNFNDYIKEDDDDGEDKELSKEEVKDLNSKIFNYFVDNPYKSDEDYHNFAEKLGVNVHEVEKIAYQIVSTFSAGGFAKSKGVTEKDVDAKELKMGIDIEMEHVDKKSPFAKMIAKRIALDHLAEFGGSDYYTLLKKMEADAE